MPRLATWIVAALLPASLHAQFYGLAPTDRGQLYFSSGDDWGPPLQLHGTPPPRAGTAFQFVPGSGLAWFAPDWGPVRGRLDVSADGRAFGVTDTRATLVCTVKECHYVDVYTSRIAAPGIQLASLPGQVQLSRNGRYALLSASDSTPVTVMDLVNGTSRAIAGNSAVAVRQAITSDGAVALWDSHGFVLDRGGDSARFMPAEAPGYLAPIVNDAGTRMAYVSVNGNLRVIDVATGEDTALAKGYSPSISADGRELLFLGDAAQVSAISVGGPVEQLTSYPEGFNEAILSADGSAAYAITRSNRIVRIDVASHSVTEIVPRTPLVPSLDLPFEPVPGSLNWVYGIGLSDGPVAAQSENLPMTLNGVRVKIGQFFALILDADAGRIRFQIPFEAPTGPADFSIVSDSPFYQPLTIDLQPWYLWFPQLSPETLDRAIHQDFGSMVTLDNPAQPGEIVHFYALGLGPVSPHVVSGAPGPSDPPAATVTPALCSIGGTAAGTVPLLVRFAGLAPGLHGVYQVSVQLPDAFHKSPGARYMLVQCGNGDQSDWVSVAVPED